MNTATGEKSGEMLALAKFSSSDEQPAPENQNPGGQPEGGNQGGGDSSVGRKAGSGPDVVPDAGSEAQAK